MNKLLTLTTALTVLGGGLNPTPALARDFVVVLDPALADAQVDTLMDALDALARDDLQPGDSLRAYTSGQSPTLIAQADVTETNRNRRARQLSVAMADISDALPESPAATPGPLQLPALLEEVMGQALADSDPASRQVCILALGDPRYRDAREPQFDMAERFFSDGLLLASSTVSPYGTADRQGLTRGVNLHVVDMTGDWPSDILRQRTERGWSLFMHATGGVLATYSPNLETAVDRWRACAPKAGGAFAYDSTREVEAMIEWSRSVEAAEEDVPAPTVTTVGTRTEAVATPPTIANDDWLSNPELESAETPPPQTGGAAMVGIRWTTEGCTDHVDLDIYVRSSPDLPWLYFNYTESPDGRFDRDIMDAADLGMSNGMEFVELVDIADFATLELMVNFYSGHCTNGVTGEMRAFVDGVAYATPFAITAQAGSLAIGRDGAADHPAWAVIDTAPLFRLD